MNQVEILTSAIVANITQGKRTIAQLKRELADGLAYVEYKGVNNVKKEFLMAITAIDRAIQYFEIERAIASRYRDN